MIITYNHVNYIGKAIESVLNQETEYDFEINIIEDCSTDGTQDVIREYKKKFPDKLNLYLNEKNIGTLTPPPQKVFHAGFKTMTGEYIAILEGDDFWSSPHKMQKQISFLESNPDFAGCSHNVIKVYENGQPSHRFIYYENTKPVHTIHDFVNMTSFFHLSTLMFRNVLQGVPPKYFANRYSCDIFNTMIHATYGPIRHYDEDMSVYRAHAGGNFSTMSNIKGRIYNIDGLRKYNRWLGYKYLKGFSFTINRLCREMLLEEKKVGEDKLSRLRLLKYRYLEYFYLGLHSFLNIPNELKSFANEKLTREYLLHPYYQVTNRAFWYQLMIKSNLLTSIYRFLKSYLKKVYAFLFSRTKR